MFTGIVQELGHIKSLTKKDDALVLNVDAGSLAKSLEIGASLCVNGTCLTVEKFQGTCVQLTAIAETLTKTNIGQLQCDDLVDLELSATLQTYLGGHLVSGHVDCLAEIVEIIPKDVGKEYVLKFPEFYGRYIISKGSITLDGISLTVAEKSSSTLKVALIPETLTKTRAGQWFVGQAVNMEVDQVAKYIENFVQGKEC